MKAFITNKKEFDNFFFGWETEKYFTPNEIHKELYNELLIDIDTKNLLNMHYLIDYKRNGNDGQCMFSFVAKKGEVFFFEFSGTVC